MKKILTVFTVSLFLTNAVKAQPDWIRIFDPGPQLFNLRPYYYFGTAVTPQLTAIQQNASNGVVALDAHRFNTAGARIAELGSSIGTATFIKTPPDSPFICLLTAGHNILRANDRAPAEINLENIGFRCRRTAVENAGDDFSGDVEFFHANLVSCKVFGAEFTRDINGYPTSDFALLAYPKSLFPAGISIYELPYSFPDIVAVPATANEELFMLHYADGMPQRLSELSNAHEDAAQNHHFIQTAPIPQNGYWDIGYWSNGSTYPGCSGAALISSRGGQPTVIGIHTVGSSILDAVNLPAPTPQLFTASYRDRGRWISSTYKLSNIANLIRSKCGCSDKDAEEGRSVTPIPLAQPTTETLNDQAKFTSATPQGLQYTQHYSHTGDLIVTIDWSSIQTSIHSRNGSIRLATGFNAQASKKVELIMGLISSYVPASQPSFTAANTSTLFSNKAESNILRGGLNFFKIYPSPTRGIINIVPVLNNKAYTIYITDITGTNIYKETIPVAGNRLLDIGTKIVAAGIYLINCQFIGVAKPVTFKIVIIK